MATTTYSLLKRTVLTSNTNPITITGIPQTGYTDLKLVFSSRTSHNNTPDDWNMSINGDSAAVYSYKLISGTGSTITNMQGNSSTGVYAGWTDASPNTANTFANIEIYFPNYTSGNNKSWHIDGVYETNGNPAYMYFNGITFAKTTAISSITLGAYNNPWVAGTTVSVYGISNVNTSPGTPKATGGDIIRTDGTYWYHAFLSSGTFTPSITLSCDILQVAGGGGGGGAIGAGGGAGGLLTFTSQSISTTSSITVGAGGNYGSATANGTNGSNSQFASLTASIGGGRGGTRGQTITGATGGSGGGGTGGGAGAAGTAGQGFAGGTSPSDAAPAYAGAGGGGAGAVGTNTTSTTGGNGGIGATSALINSIGTATYTGQFSSPNYYYAGGGAGGTDNPTGGGGTPGTPGLGGGGAAAASRSVSASAGTANTGGGGGGNSNGNGTVGGNGGSGIVVVRYAV